MANSKEAHIVIKAEDLPYVREELERLTAEVDTLDGHLGEAYHELQTARAGLAWAALLVSAFCAFTVDDIDAWWARGLVIFASVMWGIDSIRFARRYWKARAK